MVVCTLLSFYFCNTSIKTHCWTGTTIQVWPSWLTEKKTHIMIMCWVFQSENGPKIKTTCEFNATKIWWSAQSSHCEVSCCPINPSSEKCQNAYWWSEAPLCWPFFINSDPNVIYLYFLLLGDYMYIYLLLCLMLNISIQSAVPGD